MADTGNPAAGRLHSHHRRVIVVGGSLVGLIAANLFHRLGWEVAVFERTTGALEGRGAGITVLPGLVEGFRAAGVNEAALDAALGIELPVRVALDRAGRIVAERRFSQVMTSWRHLYELLKAVLPKHLYHSGVTVERIEQNDARVTACLAGGERVDADLLIGADGLRSTVRDQLLPELKPYYPGYIAWRCLTDESALPAATHAALFQRYSVCIAPGEQGIGYAVPGQDGSLKPGNRQYNVVWYHPVEAADLAQLMTDDSGRHHASGIAPSHLSGRVREEMLQTAQARLAPQFAEAIQHARIHFLQPILDLESPRLVFGRVVIIGDAAFVARPHVAMGVPKGAGDAIALVLAVQHGGSNILSALDQFEAQRLRVGRAIVARGRYLGSYMEAQLKPAAERERAEQLRVFDQVMMETAMPMAFS